MSASAPSGNTPAFAPLDEVETTDETRTGRAGLSLFSRYVRNIRIYPDLERLFGPLRKSAKGQPVRVLFHQIFCFLLDGTSRYLVRFDDRKREAGYAAAIEVATDAMASSHMIKRFFYAFERGRVWLFRQVLQQLFLWRLKITEPEVIVLGIDSMVMDNDEALKREGVEPTYKKVKGFQPLQFTWGRFCVDAVFRGGSKHSNHGDTAPKAIRHLTSLIREHYDSEVPIIFAADVGFFDQKVFGLCEELGVGYVTSGYLYEEIKMAAHRSVPAAWRRYENADQIWDILELGDRRSSWDRFRRVLYTRPHLEGEQRLFRFRRPETTIYTNLGLGGSIDAQLRDAGLGTWLRARKIVELHHGRGRDELVHRALKDFRDERLPFQRFLPNAAFYYTTLVAFNLYEAFKEDGLEAAVPLTFYATRIRREVIDIAGKIIRTGGDVILKITNATVERLNLRTLWDRTADPPRFCWA